MIEFSYICYSSYLPVSDFVIKSAIILYTCRAIFIIVYRHVYHLIRHEFPRKQRVYFTTFFAVSELFFAKISPDQSDIDVSRLYLFKQLGR